MDDGRPGTGVVVLDGGLATELQRAGLAVAAPWWSTRALLTEPDRRTLRQVHARYLAAGAQVITANTFRCNQRALAGLGLDAAGHAWMVHAAVGVAQAARNIGGVGGADRARIAGSMAPVADCYRPDLVPPDDELRTEHRWLATELVRSGVDVVLIETMNTAREARIALAAVQAAGGDAWVGFVCTDDARLLSGERLADAAVAVESDGVQAVLVNCSTPAATESALRALREVCTGPIGAYPNIEDRSGVPRWTHVDRSLPSALPAEDFADLTARWRDRFSLRIVGGCCGTTPEHIARLTASLTDC